MNKKLEWTPNGFGRYYSTTYPCYMIKEVYIKYSYYYVQFPNGKHKKRMELLEAQELCQKDWDKNYFKYKKQIIKATK